MTACVTQTAQGIMFVLVIMIVIVMDTMAAVATHLVKGDF